MNQKKLSCIFVSLLALSMVGCSSGGNQGSSNEGITAYAMEKKEYFEDEKPTQTYEITINEQGLPTSGAVKDGEGNEIRTMECTLENDKLKTLSYTDVESKDVITYTYDDRGNTLTHEYGDSVTKYTYDDNSQPTVIENYSDDKLVSKTVYTYESDGKISSKVFYLSSQVSSEYNNYCYDEKGNVTSYDCIDNGETKKVTVENTYNGDQLIKVVTHEEYFTLTEEFQYDNHGNLIDYKYDNESVNGVGSYAYHAKYTYKAISVKTAEEKAYIEKLNSK